MPYRFTFEGDELLKYEFPRSGEMEYADSIKETISFLGKS